MESNPQYHFYPNIIMSQLISTCSHPSHLVVYRPAALVHLCDCASLRVAHAVRLMFFCQSQVFSSSHSRHAVRLMFFCQSHVFSFLSLTPFYRKFDSLPLSASRAAFRSRLSNFDPVFRRYAIGPFNRVIQVFASP